MRKLNIGLTQEQRAGVIELLNRDLSDAYLLLIKTKKFHWDVVGPQFRSLHQMWEEQYQALTETIDQLAERIRTLGGYPVGTAEGFLKYGSIKEQSNNIPQATEMVAQLVDDHELGRTRTTTSGRSAPHALRWPGSTRAADRPYMHACHECGPGVHT